MSEELNRVLELASEKSIRDLNMIENIINGLMNSKASYLMSSCPKKDVPSIIARTCNIGDEKYNNLSLIEVISLLYNSSCFSGFETEYDDGTIDNEAYPYTLAFMLCNNFLQLKGTVPEITQFLKMNFYKFSQYITSEISKRDMRKGVRVCSGLMRKLAKSGKSYRPDNDDTLGDVFTELCNQYRKNWNPGVEEASKYIDRVLSIFECMWIMLIVYPYEALQMGDKENISNLICEFGDI